MKRRIGCPLSVLVGLLIIGWLTGCKQQDGSSSVAPATGTIQKIVAPEVLAVSIPDIPAGNIGIDTVANRISVTLPENYSITSPTVSFTLSCTQCAVGYSAQSRTLTIPLAGIGRSDPDRLVEMPISDVLNHIWSFYTIAVRPTGIFDIIRPVTPIVVEAGVYDKAPGFRVRNFLDGQGTEVLLINTDTGEKRVSTLSFCASSIGDCLSYQFNQVHVETGGLLPGTYDLQLTKSDRRQQVLSKAITVVRGKPGVQGFDWGLADNSPVLVLGINLYDDFKPELLLTSVTNETVRVAITDFDERRSRAILRLPPTTQPGRYVAKVVSTKGETVLPNPFFVLRYPNQPILFDIRKGGQTALESLELATPYWVNLSRLSPIKKDRLFFKSLTTTNAPFEIPLVVSANFYLYGPDGGDLPNFTLPSTTPPGRYQISLRIYDTETTYRDSEPFFKELVVR